MGEPVVNGVVKPAGERRIVTVLVTDVVGSTAIAERLGPERSKVLFDDVARTTDEQVLRFGGTVAQHTGDGVLALFGAPVAHGDDAERAVRAALAVQEALRPLAADVTAAYGIELAVRAAVNTGPATVLTGDLPPDVAFNALGDTVNVAARLQAHAEPGGVVLGPVTEAEVRDRFACDAVGPLTLVGRSEPIAAYRLAGERSTVPAPRTPFVGRAAELATVCAALADVVAGRGALVVVTGEPGIGKTRLVAEAVRTVGERARILEGQGVSYAESFPYWPVRGLIRSWLDLPGDAPEAQLRVELRAGLDLLLGEAGAAPAFESLAPLAGVPLEPAAASRQHALSSDVVRARAVDALRDVLVAVARNQPVIVVLDDLHWADEATLGLVGDLLPLVDEEGLGLLLGFRSERDHPAWRLGELARARVPHRYREVELRGLDDAESRQLVDAVAGATVPEEVDALLCARAGGNPFFLEQALRDLVERGALALDGRGLRLVGTLATTDVPWVVQEALQARLDRLAPATRAVVSAASVLGRTFARPVLEDLLDDRTLGPPLSELQRLDLVEQTRRWPSAEYRFRHGMVQEVAYGGLLEGHRRALHRRAAELLEPLACDCDDELGLLGHHWAAAGDGARAATYLVRAGDVARRMYADAEAFTHYQRALTFQRDLGDWTGARGTLLRLALARHQAFDFAGADAAWAQAGALPEPSALTAGPLDATLETPVHVPDSVVPGVNAFGGATWVSRHLFRGLLRADRDGGAEPDGAVSLSVSPDGRRYLFRLRPTARWHDGVPVTAADYVFAHRGVVEGHHFGTTLLRHVESVTALGDLELELRLSRPMSHLPHLLSFAMLFPWPAHRWQAGPPGPGDLAGLIGNGPFRIDRVTPEGLRLVATDAWDRPRGNVGTVLLPYRRPGAVEELRATWRAGRYDLVQWLGSFEGEPPPDTVRHEFPMTGTQYLALRAGGALTDPRVRRALLLVAPLAAAASGSVPARGGLISPAVLAHSPDLGWSGGSEQAAALLAAAGHPGGAGLPVMRLSLPEGLVGAIGDPSRLVDAWGALGVRTEVVQTSPHAMADTIGDPATSAWVSGWLADSPDPVSILEAFLAAHPMALQPDVALRAVLDRAAGSTDRDERIALCRQFERTWIAERGALRPLSYLGGLAVTRPWVGGFWTTFAEAPTADQLTVRPRP